MALKNSAYNLIAKDYHLKRKKPWKDLENFILYLKNKQYKFFGTSIDLGCANGRHFKILSTFSEKLIGIDNSNEFLKIAISQLKNLESTFNILKSTPQLILSDICYLPIRPKSFHNVFSIATIHHVHTNLERNKIFSQIYNILKPGGYCCITLWRKFQKKYRFYFIGDLIKRVFSYKYRIKQKEKGLNYFGDKLVSWKISKDNKTYYRFYHFFSKNEAKKIIKRFKIREFRKFGGPNKKDNFFILAQKRKINLNN
ncbi:MAG: class I SAM-dependent methyltransferase [Promethearchaeota archaeon]